MTVIRRRKDKVEKAKKERETMKEIVEACLMETEKTVTHGVQRLFRDEQRKKAWG